jgi:hypothetical protein
MKSLIAYGPLTFCGVADRVKNDMRDACGILTEPGGDAQPRVYVYRDESLCWHPLPWEWFSIPRPPEEFLREEIAPLVRWHRGTIVRDMLNVLIVDRQRERLWLAEIGRNGRCPPTLGEWLDADAGAFGERALEPLRAPLR